MKQSLLLIAITFAAIPLSFIHAPYPEELVLQHVGTLLGLACLTCFVLFARASQASVWCIILFLWLHILGARWIYSFVPYDEWARSVSGASLSDRFGWQRNHYDRLVHLASGLLFVPPASELLQRFGGMRPLGGAIMGIACVMAIGAFYEIIEWQIAMLFSPAHAEAYNGQQGDVWDPQKDLALAAIGAVISAGIVFRWEPHDIEPPLSR